MTEIRHSKLRRTLCRILQFYAVEGRARIEGSYFAKNIRSSDRRCKRGLGNDREKEGGS